MPGALCPDAGYTCLQWDFEDQDAEWPALAAVPMACVRRIVQVIPDMERLAPAYGLGRTPSHVHDTGEGRRAARFLDNILYKSTTPAQQRNQRARNKVHDRTGQESKNAGH